MCELYSRLQVSHQGRVSCLQSSSSLIFCVLLSITWTLCSSSFLTEGTHWCFYSLCSHLIQDMSMFHCVSPGFTGTAVNFSRLKHSCVFDCRSRVQCGSKFRVLCFIVALFQFCPPLFLHKSKTNKN